MKVQQHNLLACLLAFPLLLQEKSIRGRYMGTSGASPSRSRSAFVRKVPLKIRGGVSSNIDVVGADADVGADTDADADADSTVENNGSDENNMATSQPQPHPGAVSSHNLKTKNLCKKYARIGLIDLSSPTTATDSGEKSSSSRRNIRSGSSNDNVITITIPPISTSSTTAATTITASRSAFSSILKKWVQQHLVVDNSGKNGDQNIMDISSICAIPISSNADDNDSNEKELYIQQGKWINNDHGSSSSSSSFTTSTLQKKDFCTIVETMGCLVDSVIVLYDAKFEHRHSAIVSLLKGIQRQQRSRKESKSTDDNGGGGNNKNSSKGVDLIFLANSDRALLELDGMKDVLMDDNYGPIGSIYIMPVIATGDDDDDDDIDHDKCEVIDKYVRDIMGKISSIDDNTIVERPVHIGAFHKLVQSVHLKLSGKKNSGNKKVEIEFNTIQVKEEMQVVDEDMVKEDINRGNQLDSNSSCEISNENGNESDNLTSTPSDNDNFVREIKLEDEVKKETIQVEEKQTIEEKTINIDQTGRSQKVIEKEKSQNYQSNTAEDRKALESVLVEKSEEIIQRANALMYELEKEQDEILLEPETKMPILHFGKVADGILRKTFYGFDDKDLSKFVQYNQDSEMLEGKLCFHFLLLFLSFNCSFVIHVCRKATGNSFIH